MVVRWSGSMVGCQNWPRQLNRGFGQASIGYGDASAPTITAKGGRMRSGHGDVARRRNNGEAVRGTEALPSTASKQCGCGEAVEAQRNYGGGEGATRCELGAGNGDGGKLSLR